jgi:hypothetical protein
MMLPAAGRNHEGRPRRTVGVFDRHEQLAAPPAPAHRKNGEREVGGVPLRVRRTGGAKWLRSLLRKPGEAPGDIQ